MKLSFVFTVLIFVCSGLSGLVFGQTTDGGVKPSVITGDVVSVDPAKIVVNSKSGPVDVALNPKTAFKRVSPTNPSPSAATDSSLADIGVGDKLMVTGILAADGKSIPARAVYLMSKAEISQKNAKEAAEWTTRGITGKVLTANTATGQINVEIRTLTGSSRVMLTPKADAKFLRYAPNSERFNEAKESTLEEVKSGDMIRAVGDKSADGTALTAEKILTGAFQTVAGTVVSIDAAKNEVVIKNLVTKKDVTIEVTDTSLLKKYPAEMAERMAGFQAGGMGGGARPVGQGGGARPAGQPGGEPPTQPGGQGGGQPGRGGFGGARPGGAGGGGNIDEMLERFPTIKPADLKVGDMIAVSSTKNASVDRIRAIKLLAGVEPFLRMAQAANGRGGRNGQGGVEQGFQIPGLDGIGFP